MSKASPDVASTYSFYSAKIREGRQAAHLIVDEELLMYHFDFCLDCGSLLRWGRAQSVSVEMRSDGAHAADNVMHLYF